MEKSTRPFSRATRAICALAIVVLLPGCMTTCSQPVQPPPTVVTKSGTELAVEQIKSEWLVRCAGLETSMPANDIGSLLNDYNDLAGVSATCLERHNSFVDYMKPIVEKEKARKLSEEKK